MIHKPLTKFQKEFRLQVCVVKQLPIWYPGLLWLHIPNKPGGETDAARAKDGALKKMMGVKAGASDLMFHWREVDPYLLEKYGIRDYWKIHAAYIELKAPEGKLETPQNKFLSAYSAIGCHTAVCNTARGVHAKLESWGLRPASRGITEPDYRTLDDKHKAAADWQAPVKDAPPHPTKLIDYKPEIKW